MQAQIHFSGNSAYWNNSLKLGTIFPSESTFQSVPRSQKNVFRVFNGLGINEELLINLRVMGIKFIEVPFNGSILSTTVNKWLTGGIRSPYASDKVDRQIILSIEKISLEESKPSLNQSQQLNLFAGMLQ